MRSNKLVLLTVLSLLSSPLMADDKGLYLGAGITSVETDKTRLSDEDTSYKAYLGYRANGYLAFEGALVDLGDFSGSNLKFEGQSAQVSAHVGFPIGQRVRLFGSLGAHAWDANGNAAGDDTGVDLKYGVGAELDVFSNIGVRAEYEILEVGRFNIEQTSASAFILF